MPNDATINDIKENYWTSWKLMLKANAIYRDGSKLSQPLSSTKGEGIDELLSIGTEPDEVDETIGPKEIHEQISYKVQRRRLPTKRTGYVQEATVGGHKVYLRTGEYPDRSLGEIFIDCVVWISFCKDGPDFRRDY